MLNYVNAISCSVSDNKNEYVLTFRQLHPSIDSEGKVTDTIVDTVSEIVLNHDTAVALHKLLEGALSTTTVVE